MSLKTKTAIEMSNAAITKIDFIRDCASCGYRIHYSKGRDICSRNGRFLPPANEIKDTFPYSCPLPNYPDYDDLDRENRRLKTALDEADGLIEKLGGVPRHKRGKQ